MFIKKRINRLYPTFWIAMIITFLITYLANQGKVGFVDMLVNFTMIPSVFGFEPVDGVYWTLQYELLFYIMISFILLKNKSKIVKIIIVLWLLISIFFNFLQSNSLNALCKIVRVFGIIDYASVFLLGTATGLFKKKKVSRTLYLTITVLSFLSFYLYKGLNQTLFLVINYTLLQYLTSYENSFLNKENVITRPISWVASLSYPLYLLHQKIGYIIISGTISLTMYDGEAVIILPMFVSIVIAYCLHRYVESNVYFKIFKIKKYEDSNHCLSARSRRCGTADDNALE